MRKKKVENLPRTGIEYIFTKERRNFITAHKEFELLSENPAPPFMIDQFIYYDGERANALPSQYPIVYDCIDSSPYYE
jgi:hypothetical protein